MAPPGRTAELAWTLVPSFVLALGGLAVGAKAHLAPKDMQTMTAVFAPWWDAERTFASAARVGAVVAMGPASNFVTVHDTGANLAERLRAAGAIAVINPSVAAFCGAKIASK